MKAYCINLDRRPDRWEHMTSQFKRAGIEVERVSAVDGSLPDMAEKIAALKPGVTGMRLGAGAYACFQSHRLCWQKLLDSGEPRAMILEDDLVVADGFGDYLVDDWVPGEADVVRLETRAIRVHLDRKKIPIGRNRYLSRLRSTHYGAACYVFSHGAAERLLRVTSTISDAVDEVLFDERHDVFATLAIYQMTPGPVIQGDVLPDRKTEETWSHTSIDLRFGPGEFANTTQESMPKRASRRFKEELKALISGTQYTLVRHG